MTKGINDHGGISAGPGRTYSLSKAPVIGLGDSDEVLRAGTIAPDFELRSTPTETIRLRDLRGKAVILAFYPADFSPVCGDQIALYNEVLPEFRKYGAEILGISVDSRWCHAAFVSQKNIHFPLLADFEPKGEVGRRYGAYRRQDGTEERAIFVIDRSGVIQWSYLSPVDVNPGADGILEALDALRERESTLPRINRLQKFSDTVTGALP